MNNDMLIKILSDNNRLVMPGFGAILSKVDEHEKVYVFSPFLKKDDGRLCEAMSREYGVDQHDAEAMVQEFVAHVESMLVAGGRYRIPGVGILMVDDNGVVVMHKDIDVETNALVNELKAEPVGQSARGQREDVSTTHKAPAPLDFHQESMMRSAQDRVVDLNNIGSRGRVLGNEATEMHDGLLKVEEVVVEREVVIESNLASAVGVGSTNSIESGIVNSTTMATSIEKTHATAASNDTNIPRQSAQNTQSSAIGNRPVVGAQTRNVNGVNPAMMAGRTQQPVVRQVVSRSATVGVETNRAGASMPSGANNSSRVNNERKVVGAETARANGVPTSGVNPAGFRSPSSPNPMNRTNGANTMGQTNASTNRAGASRPTNNMGQSASAAGSQKIVRNRRSADSLDVWLIVAIVAAAIALGLMIYGYVVSNQTVDVEPLTQIELLDNANVQQ